MSGVIILILILIVLVCAHLLITELKYLIIMIKIKRFERLCKKVEKELLEIMKND